MHERLIKLLKWPCRIEDCENPPAKVRFWPNPIWGFDENGGTLTEAQFLADLETLIEDKVPVGFTVEQVRIYCQPHFDAVLPDQRRNLEKPDQPGDSGAGPSDNQLARTKKFRTQVLELLGQKCAQCNRGFQVKSLEVRLRSDVTASFWAQNGISSWADKYAYLADLEIDPTELVEAVCRSCSGSRVSNGSTPAKQNLRARVVEGYGGKCGVCEIEVSSRVAWVVRKSGFPAMRHAGGVGRKLTSKQKYERLLAEGCPGSHELRCPNHRDTDSLGPESGLVGN